MATFTWRQWLRSWFARKSEPVQRRPRARLAIDYLEDRVTPTSFVWSGGSPANGNWSTGANWVGGNAPNPLSGNDSLIFPSSAARLTSTDDFANATFQSIAFNGGGYTLNGIASAQLTITGTITASNPAGPASIDSINIPIQFGGPANANQFVNITNAGAELHLNQALTNAQPIQLTVNGNGTNAVGTLVLSGNNAAFSAPITVQGGVLEVTSATALGAPNAANGLVTIQPGAQLEISTNQPTTFTAPLLLLNGSGPNNTGALLNLAGTNTWATNTELDSNVTLGATAGTLKITGQITDKAGTAGFGITKEGSATIELDPTASKGNNYRGQTIVNNGTLAIAQSHALGVGNTTLAPGAVPTVTDSNGIPVPGIAIVQSFSDRSGTLQLLFDPSQVGVDPGYNVTDSSGTVTGFTVPDEPLILNGPGLPGVAANYYQDLTGALNNASGTNKWEQDLALWSNSAAVQAIQGNTSNGHVTIGVKAGTIQNPSSLQIDGNIGDNAGGKNFFLDKVDNGELIFPSANTYNTGAQTTEILSGTLTIQDSQALGVSLSTVNVNPLTNSLMPGALATLELKADARPDSLNPGTTNLTITKNIQITGSGVLDPVTGKPVGALYNAIGINTFAGSLTLGGNFQTGGATIGVAADFDPFNTVTPAAFDNLSQLTMTTQIGPGFLHKSGLGELVLNPLKNPATPGANNQSQTYIDEGWITIENSLALGNSNTHTYAAPNGNPYGGQFPNGTLTNGTWVASNAALVLKQNPLGKDPVTNAANLSVPDDLILNGNGLSKNNTLVYTELYQSATDVQNNAGALINLSGANTITGIIYLNGTAGIGVALDEHAVPAVAVSQLDLGPIGQFTGVVGGIDKWGIKGLNLQGEGWYTGNVDIHFGVLTVQNSTALGLGISPATTTVESGAALVLEGSNPQFAAGIQAGVSIGTNEHLILNGPGNTTLTGSLISTLTSANDPTTSNPFDSLWQGPITLGSNINLDVQASSRLTLYGVIDDLPAGGGGAFGINFNGTPSATGELALAGTNTYRGGTTINKGLVDVENGQGLGASISPVSVNASAGLQFQGSITVGNPLTIIGTGPGALAKIPVTWFAQGPTTIGGLTQTESGTDAVSGEVTGVAADPTDPNLLYLSSAGGGAWRSRNDGQSWQPLVDTTTQVQVQTGIGTSNPATLGQLALATGTITVAPAIAYSSAARAVLPALSSPDIIYIGLGDPNNSPTSLPGAGVLATTDGGLTWTLLQGPNISTTPSVTQYAFQGKAISQISMDPTNPNIIYIAVSQARSSSAISTGTGIWRYDPTQATFYDPNNPSTSVWANLTQTLPIPASGSKRLAANNGPNTPGPEEDLNLTFTDTDDYTSVIVYDDPANILSYVDTYKAASPNNKLIFMAVGTENPVPQPAGNNFDYLNAVYISVDSGTTWHLYGFPTATDSFNNVNNPHNGRISLAVNYTLPNPLPANNAPGGVFSPNGTFSVYALSSYAGTFGFSNNIFWGGTGTQLPSVRDTFREIDTISLTWDTSFNPDNRGFNYNAPFTFFYELGWAPGGTYSSPGTWTVGVNTAGQINGNFMGITGPQQPFNSKGQYDNVIAVNPEDGMGNEVFIGGIGDNEPQGIAGSGPYESLDGGATWNPIVTQGLPGPHSDAHAMAFDPGANNLLFGTNGGLWEFGLTGAAAGNWTNLNTAYLQITQVNSVAASAASPFQAYAGTFANGFITLANGTWQETDSGNSGSVIVNSQNPTIIYQMTDTGLRKSIDGGLTWNTVLNNVTVNVANPPAESPYSDPFAANVFDLIGGTTGYASLGLMTDFAPAVIDPSDPNRLLAYVYRNQGGSPSIWESLDGGATWSDLDPTGQIPKLYGGPFNTAGHPAYLPFTNYRPGYFATSIGLAQFQGNFVADPRFPAVLDQGANSLAPDVIYVTSALGVFETKNRGNTWVEDDQGGSNSLPVALSGLSSGDMFSHVHYQDVAIDPNNENIAYVAISDQDPSHGHIYKTVDGGQNWTDLTGNLSPTLGVWKVIVDPRNANVYIGTDDGVWELPGGSGSTWQKFGNGLPDAQVRDLSLNTSLNTLTAATYGRGVFTMFLDNPLPVTVPAAVEGVLRSVSGSATLTGAVSLLGDVTIRTDAGTQLALLGNVTNAAGTNDVITKVGTGKIVLGGNDSYGGAATSLTYTPKNGPVTQIDTDIKEGILAVHSATALGDGTGKSSTLVEPGAVLELQSDLNTEPVILNGDGGSFNNHNTGSLRSSSNTNNYSGTLTLNSNATIGVDSGSQLTITGSIIDNGNGFQLTKELTGTLVFAGSNTFNYSGMTSVIQGALQIQNPKSVINTKNITETDGAQVQLQAPSGQTNLTVITAAPLILTGTGINNTGALISQIAANASTADDIWQGPIVMSDNPSSFPATNPGQTVAFGANPNTILEINGPISENTVQGSFTLSKIGTGKMILEQANSYTGGTNVLSGELVLEANDALGLASASATTTVSNGASLELQNGASPSTGVTIPTSKSLVLQGSAPASGGNGFNNQGTLLANGGSNFWNGTVALQVPAAGQTSVTVGAVAGAQVTISGVISDFGAAAPFASFSKVGPGTVALATANNYAGQTFVNNGVLLIENNGALGTNAAGTTVTSAATSGTLQLGTGINVSSEPLFLNGAGFNGAGALDSTVIGAAASNTWSGSITLQTNASLGAETNATLVISTPIADAVPANADGVTTVGGGTVVLGGTATNTYTGTTQANGFLLQLDVVGAPALSGPLAIGQAGGSGTATAQWLQNNQVATAPAKSFVTVNSNGVLDLNDKADTINQLTILDGAVKTTDGAGGKAQLTVNGLFMRGGSITLDQAGSALNLNGLVTATSDGATGNAVITTSVSSPVIPGQVKLSTNGTSNETFNVLAGFNANNPQPLPDLTISVPIAGFTGASTEQLIKQGSGLLRLTATNTYAGLTDVQAGILQIDGTINDVRINGGTVSGSGTVGNITATATGGILMPGDLGIPGSPTFLTATGNVTLNSSVTLSVHLVDSSGPHWTELHATGASSFIDLGSAILAGTFQNLLLGESFEILKASQVKNTFTTPPFGTPSSFFVSGIKFGISYQDNSGTDIPNNTGNKATKVILTKEQNVTTTTVTPSSTTPVYGQPVSYTITVAAEPGAGKIPVGPPPNGTTVTVTFDNAVVPGNISFTPSQLTFNAATSQWFATTTFTPAGQPLSIGTHTIVVTYNGNGDFMPSNSPAFIGSISESGTTVTVNTTTPDGFKNNDMVTIAGVSPAGYDGTFAITVTSPTQFTYTAPSSGLGTATLSNATATGPAVTVNVVQAPTTLTVTPSVNPAVFGQTVTLNAQVSALAPSTLGTLGGTATFYLNGNQLGTPQNLDPTGNAQVTLPSNLAVGSYQVQVDYSGDHNYLPFSQRAQNVFKIERIDKASTQSVVNSNVNPSVYGQANLQFSATVVALLPGSGTPTGSVTFFDATTSTTLDQEPLSNGTAVSVRITNLSVGTHNIQAIYSGDASFLASTSSNLSQVVNQDATVVSVSSATNPSVTGQSVSFTAQVQAAAPGSGTPTGTAFFTISSGGVTVLTSPNVALIGGVASYSAPGLLASQSPYTVTATYNGDPSFSSQTGTMAPNQTVNLANTTVTVASSLPAPGGSVFGQAITFTATIAVNAPGSGNPTGTVQFFDNGSAIGAAAAVSGNKATLVYAGLNAANHTITAQYQGDKNFNPSPLSAGITQPVGPAKTAVSVTSSANPSVFGQNVTFTATVTAVAPGGGTPSGTVTFIIDGVQQLPPASLNASGVATFSISSLSINNGNPHTVTANYSGSTPNFLSSSTTSSVQQLVTQDNSLITVTADNNPAAWGQNVTFTATVTAQAPGSGTPSGSVTITIDGVAQPTLTLDATGKVSLPPTMLSVGGHVIAASYAGDTNFFPSSSTLVTETVTQDPTTTTVTASGIATAIASATESGTTATITTATPHGYVNGETVQIGGVSVAGYNGTFNVTVTSPTTFTYTAGASGLANGSGGTAATTLPPVFGQSVVFTAQVIPNGPAITAATEAGSTVTITTGAAHGFVNNEMVTISGVGVTGYNGTFKITVVNPTTFTYTAPSSGLANSGGGTATGGGSPTGSVTFTVDGVAQQTSQPLNAAGQASVTLSALSITGSPHTIFATYTGDTNFANSSSASSPTIVSVSQAQTTLTLTSSANPSVFGQNVVITATASPTPPGGPVGNTVPTGTITFTVDGTTKTATLSQGVATITLTGLSVASNHSIVASYSGDANYIGSSTAKALTQVVNQDGTVTTVTTNPTTTVYGQGVQISASVAAAAPGAGTPTGTVNFFSDNNSIGSATLSGGSASITVTGLAAGSHSITATYVGDTNFLTSTSAAATQQVNQDPTTTTVAVNPPAPVYGQTATFTATVAFTAPGSGIPTGTVTFTIDGKAQTPVPLDNTGKASINVSTLTAGSHTVSAAYSGDPNFVQSATAAAVPVTINQSSTTTNLAAAPSPSTYGQPVSFTATVAPSGNGAGIPTGTVTFLVDNVPQSPAIALDNTGKAVFTTPSLSAGSHSITAKYNGDPNFASSTTPTNLTQNVSQANTTTVITSSANPSVYGQNVTLTANVAPVAPGGLIPTGTVTFTIDGKAQAAVTLDANGNATATLTVPSLGNHTATAVYSGDANNTGSTSGTFTQQVNQDATTTALTTSAGPAAFGQNVTITATVTPNAPGTGTPTGTVTFNVDGNPKPAVTLNGGQATLALSGLSVGNHTITASYSGDTNYTGSPTPTSFTQVVNKAATTTALTSNASPGVSGQTLTITATITPTAPGAGSVTGTVLFTVDGKAQPAANVSGNKATITLTGLAVGNHSIAATYSGDGNFNTSSTSSALSQTVNQDGTTLTVSLSPSPSAFGQGVTVSATVSASAPGSGTPTGTVTFTVDGTDQPAVTLSNGQASIALTTLTAGSHSITAAYSGDTNFVATKLPKPLTQVVNAAGASVTLAPSTNPSTFGQSVTITATVAAVGPGAGTPTGTVTFLVDGVPQPNPATLSGGQATLTIASLTAGTHNITATYSGDPNFQNGSTAAALAMQVNPSGTTTSLASSAAPSTFGAPVNFTVTVAPVAPGAGIPTGNVTLFSDGSGVNTLPLDATGKAVFTVSTLTRGNHQLTAKYAGDPNFQASATAAPLSQQVTNAATATTLNVSTNPSVFGQGLVLTATVVSVPAGVGTPTGSVTFSVDGTPQAPVSLDATGKATLTITTLSTGSHNLTASYSGDSGFLTSATANPIVQQVNQAATSTAIASSAVPAAFGDNITFTAFVGAVAPGSGIPTGTVIFTVDNGAPKSVQLDSSGKAILTLNNLARGNHTVVAQYAGDSNFQASQANLAQEIDNAASATALTAAPTPTVFGQAVTFTAAVSAAVAGLGTPTGSIVLSVDGNQQPAVNLDATGKASVTLTGLTAGSHTVTATYSGDSTFQGGTGTLTQSVGQAGTTTTLNASASPAAFGQGLTFTAVIAPVSPGAGTPTGSVVFTVDGTAQAAVSLSNGQAAFQLNNPSVGNHTVSAAYSGDSNFKSSSTATPLADQVNAATTTTALMASAAPSPFSQPVTITATVSPVAPGAGVPTGSVVFTVDGSQQPAVTLDASGKAALTLPSLAAGSHTISAAYSGATGYQSSSAALTQQVSSGVTSTSLTASPAPSVFGQGVTFVATVAGSGGVPTGLVTFSVDGGAPTAVPLDGTGKAALTLNNLGVGSHTISAAYSGDTSFQASTATVGQQVNPGSTTTTVTSVSTSGQDLTITAAVAPTTPGAPTPSGTVTFLVDGVPVGAADLVNGTATFTAKNVTPGHHTVTAAYSGSANFASSPSAAGGTVANVTASTSPSSASTTAVTTGVQKLTVSAVRTTTSLSVTVSASAVTLKGAVVKSAHGKATITLVHGPKGVKFKAVSMTMKNGKGKVVVHLPKHGTYTFKVTFGTFTKTFVVASTVSHTKARRQG